MIIKLCKVIRVNTTQCLENKQNYIKIVWTLKPEIFSVSVFLEDLNEWNERKKMQTIPVKYFKYFRKKNEWREARGAIPGYNIFVY